MSVALALLAHAESFVHHSVTAFVFSSRPEPASVGNFDVSGELSSDWDWCSTSSHMGVEKPTRSQKVEPGA